MAKRNMITVKDVNIRTIQKDGLWERLHNPLFKRVEFDPFFAEAGSNSFTMSPTRWVEIAGLNVALFGFTAKQWREANPDLKGNIRDYATINELICLANMENLNSVLINDGVPQSERLVKLNQITIHQMQVLDESESRKLLK